MALGGGIVSLDGNFLSLTYHLKYIVCIFRHIVDSMILYDLFRALTVILLPSSLFLSLSPSLSLIRNSLFFPLSP